MVAFDPPASPVQSNKPDQRVTLVPFGAEDLRITDFPLLGKPDANISKPIAFDFIKSGTSGWSWIGGGWCARDGKLCTTSNGGAPGSKALIDNLPFTDGKLEVDVTPPAVGDAGIVFRVEKPSIGADAYEGYYAGISTSSNQVILGSADGKRWTPLEIVRRTIPTGRSTKVIVTAHAHRIEVRLNNEAAAIIAITDDRWSGGKVGVRTYAPDKDHADATFKGVRIDLAMPTAAR